MRERCHEVLVRLSSLDRYVCEHANGYSHTHADEQPYMRPLREGERWYVNHEEDKVLLVEDDDDGAAVRAPMSPKQPPTANRVEKVQHRGRP